MYSYDDRIRAVRLYIQYDKSAAAVIRELGYPGRKTLRYWYEEYLRDNGLKKKSVRSPKYNGAQKEAAVKHYMEHGKCASRTIRALGYPSRALLKQWVTELCPEEKPHCSAGRSMVHLTKEQKNKGEITPAVPNEIKRDFHADAPNQKWLTDIMEFSIPAGKVYLSPIIDCFDGLPVSWTIGASPNADFVNQMLDAAIEALKPGEYTEEKVKIVQDADAIFREEMEKAGLNKTAGQYFAALTNMRSVGVMGDERTYDYAIALRAVNTVDFMTADIVEIPYEVLKTVTSRIINEVSHVNRVMYDITSKPPGTIEFE